MGYRAAIPFPRRVRGALLRRPPGKAGGFSRKKRLLAMQAHEVRKRPYLPALPRCGLCHLTLRCVGWRVS